MLRIIKTIGIMLGIAVVFLMYVFLDFVNYKENTLPVLMYHGVGVEHPENWGGMLISPEAFDAQMKYLRDSGYKIVSVEEVGELLFTNKSIAKHIAITFDDGYKNNFEYAFPILKKYGATATFYLIRNALGGENYLNDREVGMMLKAGMKIGSHTMSHSNLQIIDESYYRNEIYGSKMLLEQRYDTDIVSISYPYGAYNEKVISVAMGSGYKIGVSGDLGINTPESFNDNPYKVKRIGIYDNSTDPKGFAHTIEKACFLSYLKFRGIDVLELRKTLSQMVHKFI